jgi:hypothetical protein
MRAGTFNHALMARAVSSCAVILILLSWSAIGVLRSIGAGCQ